MHLERPGEEEEGLCPSKQTCETEEISPNKLGHPLSGQRLGIIGCRLKARNVTCRASPCVQEGPKKSKKTISHLEAKCEGPVDIVHRSMQIVGHLCSSQI